MTDHQHPITPPLSLIVQWWDEVKQNVTYDEPIGLLIAAKAAQWGADQELEACCEWAKQFNYDDEYYQDKLRAARRPKPPSLKEQALEKLMNLEQGTNPPSFNDYNTIRRALEALPNDH
jgi:hypothetical protein